jgi:hypothetical protein
MLSIEAAQKIWILEAVTVTPQLEAEFPLIPHSKEEGKLEWSPARFERVTSQCHLRLGKGSGAGAGVSDGGGRT